MDEVQKAERIVLEDLTAGFVQPCILDIKMGTQTFEEDADFMKKLKLGFVDSMSTTKWLGCRVVGMKASRTALSTRQARTANVALGLTLVVVAR